MNTSSGHHSFYSNHTTLYLGHHYLQATYVTTKDTSSVRGWLPRSYLK
jgi:hypothetical protein